MDRARPRLAVARAEPFDIYDEVTMMAETFGELRSELQSMAKRLADIGRSL
jgi:hypothetical protein